MAILKHIASKNADYGEAQRYLLFQYDESTNKPILDENGELIPRKEYIMDGINCDPFTFDMECRELNALYHKNESYDEIKSHHYIISFDPKDAIENGLTGEWAQQIGMEYAKKNFPGHQALVCTHMDGHNESGNIHVHIVINSLRKYDVERQDFMERACDSRAGYKHHVSKDYLIHLKQSLMDICRREHLHQVDLLAPAEKKITDREYHAKRRGQKKLDERNRQLRADGLTPRKTEFQTQKEFLRSAIEDAAAVSCSQEDFQNLLLEKYNVKLKVSRGRFSYLHPERNKYITGRMLGTHYVEDYLLELFKENAEHKENKKQTVDMGKYNMESKKSATSPSNLLQEETVSVLFIKSDLRLVVDLQACVKAQQNAAYANKVKLSNLKEMAKTVAYIQEHGYNTRDSLEDSFSGIKSHASISRKELKSVEDNLRKVNEQIHYTGQYLANKSVYQKFVKAKNKGQFRQEHPTEIALYETARKFLKEQSADGKLPSIKLLKAEKEKLLQQKKEAQKTYHYYRDYQKELNTVCSNVDKILGQPHTRQPEKQKSTDIS
ncbi:MAG: relaxase/mobilization nuclease domain-containing protein [Lachnospiraceae bacterium]